MVRSVLSKHRGREVKTIGDASLLEFDSALDATLCAIDIQQKLHEHNLAVTEPTESMSESASMKETSYTMGPTFGMQ